MSSTGGGGRDRDKNRKYVSGAAKRKARQEFESRDSKILSKVPKISELFLPKYGDVNVIEPNVEEPTTDSPSQAHGQDAPYQFTATDNAAPTNPIPAAAPEQFELSDQFLTSDSPSTSTDAYSCALGMWPACISDSMREFWAAKGSSECRNMDADFSESSHQFEGENYKRQCNKSLFTYTHDPTKQQHPRIWLCYSPSQRAVFCFACKLMTDSASFGKEGYKDWKHASYCIRRHERSAVHRDAMIQLLQRSDAGCRVDSELV